MADFAVVPVFGCAAIATALTHGKPATWVTGVTAAAGYLTWTFTEYAMHRWGFHRLYRYDHARHHVRPRDWIGVTPWVSTLALAAIWRSMVLCFGTAAGSISFVGFAAGYFGYITIHWLIHHSSRQFIAPLKAHHDMHHRRARVNFGVSTRLWDVVFRTRA